MFTLQWLTEATVTVKGGGVGKRRLAGTLSLPLALAGFTGNNYHALHLTALLLNVRLVQQVFTQTFLTFNSHYTNH